MASNMNLPAPPCLPVIDLSELDGPQHDQVVETIVKAAENFGFFQVVNHGVSVDLLEELKDSVYRFFNQTEEEKAVYARKEGSPTESLATYHKGRKSIERDIVNVLILEYSDEQEAQKDWPDSCKEAALEYRRSTHVLAERLLGVLFSNLGVTLDRSMVDSYIGGTKVTMNHYGIYPENDGGVMVHKHTDSYTLTVLLQDHIGGLLAQLSEKGDLEGNYKGECVEIKPTPGALVIFVADVLQVLSNGRYPAAEHYVQSTGRVNRICIPIFFMPKATETIGPLPQAVEKDDGRPRYKDFTYKEYKQKVYNSYYSTSLQKKDILKGVQAYEILATE